MVSDPYRTLGVQKTASQDEIKSAYRKLAKRYHPDLNQGDQDVERMFKDVSVAYDLLGDPAKRAKFDRGEIGADGREKAGGSGFWRNWKAKQGAAGGGGNHGTRFNFDDDFAGDSDPFDDILRNWRSSRPGGATGSGGQQKRKQPSQDLRYRLKVGFVEATAGIKKKVTLSDGKVVNLTIPPASENGTVMRLKGQGKPALANRPAGDAYLELQVDPHPHFERKGKDIHIRVPVTLQEAVLGASITVPTIHGDVSLKVPKNSNTGQKLRLRGKGVPGASAKEDGDQYVILSVSLPETIDKDLSEFIDKWGVDHPYNPRKNLKS